jgi:hypothetical protein
MQGTKKKIDNKRAYYTIYTHTGQSGYPIIYQD